MAPFRDACSMSNVVWELCLEFATLDDILQVACTTVAHARSATSIFEQISSVTMLAVPHMARFVSKLSRLRRLRLVHCPNPAASFGRLTSLLSGLTFPAITHLTMRSLDEPGFTWRDQHAMICQISDHLVVLDLTRNAMACSILMEMAQRSGKRPLCPCLRTLLAGSCTTDVNVFGKGNRVSLQDLGGACPALESLDAGYSSWVLGLSYHELGDFVNACPALRHLDLSMALMMRDFAPMAELLIKAPALESIAVHNLYISDDAISLLCRDGRLRRAHFVDCFGYSSDGLFSAFLQLPSLNGLCVVAASHGHGSIELNSQTLFRLCEKFGADLDTLLLCSDTGSDPRASGGAWALDDFMDLLNLMVERHIWGIPWLCIRPNVVTVAGCALPSLCTCALGKDVFQDEIFAGQRIEFAGGIGYALSWAAAGSNVEILRWGDDGSWIMESMTCKDVHKMAVAGDWS